MDFTGLTSIVGLVLLLASLGLLKPIRNFTTGLGADVDTVNDVKSRLVKEWDAETQLNHAKKLGKLYNKAIDLGEVRTYDDVMGALKNKLRHDD